MFTTFIDLRACLGRAAVAAAMLADAGFGALLSGLLFTDKRNHDVEAFEEGIVAGDVILIVGEPKKMTENSKRTIIPCCESASPTPRSTNSINRLPAYSYLLYEPIGPAFDGVRNAMRLYYTALGRDLQAFFQQISGKRRVISFSDLNS